MRRFGFFYHRIVSCGLLIFVLSGCISVGRSIDPRFYMLKQLGKNEVAQKFNIPSGIITVIGPVGIPQYLDRPQMVTQDDKGMMNVAQFDRWGESLDAGIARLIIEDLNLMLPGGTFEMFPCNFAIPLDYQVIVGVLQLEGNLKKDFLLVAQWSIIDAGTRKMLFTKRSDLVEPINPRNYSGLAEALSKAIASLSAEIAQNISILANQPKKTGQNEQI
ncbi:MAG: PqiC family protein [Candidatus Omnitrophica bacterium]|nr:PqiC family protein [Candidatus Omnitrophota bacterium]MBU1924103.1 PqiC family protein [Candidatus Omnitrophota bacterium]